MRGRVFQGWAFATWALSGGAVDPVDGWPAQTKRRRWTTQTKQRLWIANETKRLWTTEANQ